MTKDQAIREKALDENILGMYRAQLSREITRKQKRIASARKRHKDVLDDYRNENDINEAWACNCITARKRDSLIKAFRETLPDADPDLDNFIEWLNREIVNLSYQIREMDGIIEGVIK